MKKREPPWRRCGHIKIGKKSVKPKGFITMWHNKIPNKIHMHMVHIFHFNQPPMIISRD